MPQIKIRQTGSPIRRTVDQRATLQGLGLNKLGRERTLARLVAARTQIGA